MEKYLDWIIDETDITSSFLSDGKIKLKAEIIPDIERLYNFLFENQVVNVHFSQLKSQMFYNYRNSENDNNIRILKLLIELANEKKCVFTESAYSWTSISMTGSYRTHKKAMDKIKLDIKNRLPNLRALVVEKLKAHGFIPQDRKIFCEILSKEI